MFVNMIIAKGHTLMYKIYNYIFKLNVFLRLNNNFSIKNYLSNLFFNNFI